MGQLGPVGDAGGRRLPWEHTERRWMSNTHTHTHTKLCLLNLKEFHSCEKVKIFLNNFLSLVKKVKYSKLLKASSFRIFNLIVLPKL